MGNYAFIDSQNLYMGIRAQGWDLDYARFRIYLKDKFQVEKAYIFIGYIASNNNLYSHLQSIGYTLIFKPTLPYWDDNGEIYIKGNVDAELVLHTMIELPNYDKAVIVSGDGDFHCLIKYLSEEGKLRRLIIPNQKNYSSLLLPYKSWMFFLDSNFKSKIGK